MDVHAVVSKGAQWWVVLCLVVVAFPLIAVAAFILRTVLLFGAVAAMLGAIVLFCVCPPFRRWADQVVKYSGSGSSG